MKKATAGWAGRAALLIFRFVSLAEMNACIDESI
jgi:hypothetical protein